MTGVMLPKREHAVTGQQAYKQHAHPLLIPSRQDRREVFYLKTDIDLSDARLRSLKSQAAAELDSRTPKIERLAADLGFEGAVEPLAAGSYHVAHEVRQHERSVVVRSTLSELFEEDRSLLLDGFARSWLESSGHQDMVPATHLVRFRLAGAPFDFSVVEFAAGTRLLDLGDAVLDEEPAYLAGLGEALRVVHRVQAEGAGLLDCDRKEYPRGVHDSWPDYIRLHLARHIEICVEAGYVDAPLATKIKHLFAVTDCLLHDRPMRLLHGDPGIHNVCVDGVSKRITSLLDWEDALAGDPLFDVAMVSTFHPPRRMQRFSDAYGLDPSCRDDMRLVALYFLRIALSKTVHRLRFGVKDRADRTPGHHRIYRGVQDLERLL